MMKYLPTIFALFFLSFIATAQEELDLYNLADSKSQNDEFKDAITLLTDAIRINPDYYDAYQLRGFLKTEMGDYRGAIVDLDKAHSLDTSNYFPISLKGHVYRLWGKYEEAISNYTEVINNQPYMHPYYYRGLCYRHLLNQEMALLDFNEAIALDSTFVDSYLQRAHVKLALGDVGCLDFSTAGELGHSDAYAAIRLFCSD